MKNDEKLSVWEHLDELRSRILKALVGLAIGVVAGFNLTPILIRLLAQPVGGLEKLQSIEVTENIGVFMRVSLLTGFIIAFPFILFELLAFLAPGLSDKEKRWVFMAIPFATILYLGGVAFSFFVMLPAAVPFLTSFLGVPTTPRLSNYINFTTNLLFWVGISFEMPMIVFILAKLHLLTGKMLVKQWRVALIVIAILAAVITPTTDPVNMALLMLPLMTLYGISVLLAFIAR
jgi:sec-independent protein translocase protein TatC